MISRKSDMGHPKIAVVTGGASGIGEAAARCFVAAGWAAVIGDVNETRGRAIVEELGPAAIYLKLDVASEQRNKIASPTSDGSTKRRSADFSITSLGSRSPFSMRAFIAGVIV